MGYFQGTNEISHYFSINSSSIQTFIFEANFLPQFILNWFEVLQLL
jgi:hypothetical protein